MSHRGNEIYDFLVCPSCHRHDDVRVLDIERTTLSRAWCEKVTGEAICRGCIISDVSDTSIRENSTKSLDFCFSYDTITDRVSLRVPDILEDHYYLRGEYCMCVLCDREREANENQVEESTQSTLASNPIYAVMCVNGSNKALAQLFSDNLAASQIVDRDSTYTLEVVELDGEVIADRAFKVHVVSVGSGDSLRFPLFTTNLQSAIKMATSINGRISTELVMPNHNNCVKETRMSKWFIRLEGNDEVFSVDTIRRRTHISKDESSAPFITLRRRYSNSLPLRLEVSSASNSLSEQIARNIRDRYDNDEIIDMCEYNVDYDVFRENGDWKIQPRLLESIGVE